MTIPEPSAVPPATPPLQPAPQGSSNRKLWIIIAASAAVLCLIACGAILLIGRGLGNMVENSMVDDPQEAAEVGAAVADFDLPKGFGPVGGMDIMGVKMAVYSSQSSQTAIVLMNVPGASSMDDVDMDSLRDQMMRSMGRQMSNVQIIDQYEATIRGKPAQVIIQEGTSTDGELMRMMVTMFEGKGGISMMMIMGPADKWDQDMAADVVKSIR